MKRGDVVAGRFEIELLAGSGGMGHVYRARDRTSGATVAVKLMHGRDAEVARSFEQEACVLEGLAHPGVVQHIAHGRAVTGEPYLAMEWLDGEDLAARLERQGLTVAESVTVAARAAEALGMAHAHDVVHRDVKPSNLFLVDRVLEHVRVLDFGVAHVGGATAAATRAGALLGTPAYMAPEQARGDRDIDARADVFSLGSVLFECLTGRVPFESDSVIGLLAKVLLEEAPRVREIRSDVPSELDALVARMLSKEPAGRPRDGRAVAAELAALGELEDKLRIAPSAPPSALTGREQRLLCVILAREVVGAHEPEPLSMAPTITVEEATGEVEAMRTAVHRFGARVETLLDGSLVVTLAGAGAATDQAARAARCALAVRAILPGVPVALATGRGVMGARWPVGEAIERAASLLAPAPLAVAAGLLAPSPSIRIDEVTAGLLDARFEVTGEGADLELHRERDALPAQRLVLGKVIPFVGRSQELGRLHRLLEECAAEPVARAALVTGPAGIGKSRLIRELVEDARRHGSLEVLLGQGDPMSAGSPFGLLASAIRRTCGVQDGEPIDRSRQKLRARVGRCVAPVDVARVTEFLGEMVGVPFPDDDRVELRAARRDAMFLGDQMRRAWEDWLEAECGAQPVLLVLDDLHWGDLPSVKFVDAALRNLGGRPLMVLAAARPEVHETFPRLWAERGIDEISLPPLHARSAEKLVRAALGEDVSPERIARLVERGAGNAFYLEELARAVAAGREEDLPGTVLAMVQSRLEALETEARRVLRAASVFGQVFWRSGVLSLLGGSERTTQGSGWLAELVSRELVEKRRDSNFPGEDEYAFRNALVRDAAYATLTEADRVLGHRLAGRWLELAGERDAVVLAEHFERGNEPARAVNWFRRGAEQAFGGNDFEAALSRAARGLACARAPGSVPALSMAPPPMPAPEAPAAGAPRPQAPLTLPEAAAAGAPRPRAARTLPEGEVPAPRPAARDGREGNLGALHLLLAEAHKWRGELAESEACAREAIAHLPPGEPRWFAACGELAGACGRLGDHQQLAAVAADLQARAGGRGVTAAQVAASVRAAVALFGAGQVGPGEELLDAIEQAGAQVIAEEPAVAAKVLGARAWRRWMAGDTDLYLALERQAAQSYERAGDLRNHCLARANAGYACLDLGAYAEAEEGLREALRTAERMGLKLVAASARLNLGKLSAYRGAFDEARSLLTQVVPVFSAQGDVQMEATAWIDLAELDALAGELDAAEQEARRAIAVAETAPPMRTFALAMLAHVLLARGRPAEALAAAREASGLLDTLGGIGEGEALVRVVAAEALASAGETAAARVAIAAARDRLLARAARISDRGRRESFLQQVPENARTMALARMWWGEPA